MAVPDKPVGHVMPAGGAAGNNPPVAITNNRAEKPLTAREEKKIRELIEHFSSIDVVAALIGRKPRTVHNFISRRGWSLKKPKPRATGYRLYDEVRRRAHDMNLSYVDLDRSLGYRRKMFAATSSAPKVSIGMIQKAVEALGGRLVIEWESLEGEEVSK